MSEQNTTQKLARLKQLNRDDLQNWFERLRLAAEVMEDHEWIAASFDGSDVKAMDYLATNAFALVSGIYTVGELIATYKKFPQRAQWDEYSCDLHTMVGLWRDSRKAPLEPKDRTNWRKRCEELQEENVQLRLQLADLRVEIAEMRHPVAVG